MAKRPSVIQNTAAKAASFSPPLSGLYVTVAPATSVAITVSGVSVTFTAAMLPAGTKIEVGDISAVASNSSFKYIGLRDRNLNYDAISDNLDVGGD